MLTLAQESILWYEPDIARPMVDCALLHDGRVCAPDRACHSLDVPRDSDTSTLENWMHTISCGWLQKSDCWSKWKRYIYLGGVRARLVIQVWRIQDWQKETSRFTKLPVLCNKLSKTVRREGSIHLSRPSRGSLHFRFWPKAKPCPREIHSIWVLAFVRVLGFSKPIMWGFFGLGRIQAIPIRPLQM